MCSSVSLFQLSDPSAGIVFFSLVLTEQCDFSMGKPLVSGRNDVDLSNYCFCFVSSDEAAHIFFSFNIFTNISLSHCSMSNDLQDQNVK